LRTLTGAGAGPAEPRVRDDKLNDSGGLVLFVTKAGGMHWRLRYAYNGEKLLSFGFARRRLADLTAGPSI
jgi:hypothetical protein